MSRYSLIICAIIAMAFIALATPQVDAAILCGTVVSEMTPCINYLTKGGGLGGCCAGIRKLNAIAITTPDRQAACTCLKVLSKNISLNNDRAAGLPKTCGVNVPYTISPSTDCSKVK